MAIQAIANSATVEVLAGSVASKWAGEGLVTSTSLDQTPITDEGTGDDFLDGFGPVRSRYSSQIISCLPADLGQHRQELGISI